MKKLFRFIDWLVFNLWELLDVVTAYQYRAGLKNGIKREQKRIVELLETELALYPDDLKTGFSFAIRTIKGEQK